MKKLAIMVIAVVASTAWCSAQQIGHTAVDDMEKAAVKESCIVSDKKADKKERVFENTEQTASFPGGQAALMQFLAAHLIYPEQAAQNGIQGRVIVKFIIEKDGSITNPEIVRGVNEDLDKEALRVVKLMPEWKPGRNNGVAVRSWYYLPVIFKLQN